MVPGPTRLCSFKQPGAQCAIRGAWRTDTISGPGVGPASLTPARPRPGLVDQNAGMTEPSDQVDSMYCLT